MHTYNYSPTSIEYIHVLAFVLLIVYQTIAAGIDKTKASHYSMCMTTAAQYICT